MAAKTFFVVCAQAFLMQSVYTQCRGHIGAAPFAGPLTAPYAAPYAAPLANPYAAPLAGPLAGPYGAPLASPLVGPLAASRLAPVLPAPALAYDGCAGVASTGGGFPVTSASPIAPTGLTVVSENAIEGALSVGGNLPLLGSVAVEGAFSTAGEGAVSYGCGDGEVGIATEGPIATGILAPGPVAPAPAISAGLFSAGLGLSSAPGLGLTGAGIAPGLFGSRAGVAPGFRRGCGRGAVY